MTASSTNDSIRSASASERSWKAKLAPKLPCCRTVVASLHRPSTGARPPGSVSVKATASVCGGALSSVAAKPPRPMSMVSAWTRPVGKLEADRHRARHPEELARRLARLGRQPLRDEHRAGQFVPAGTVELQLLAIEHCLLRLLVKLGEVGDPIEQVHDKIIMRNGRRSRGPASTLDRGTDCRSARKLAAPPVSRWA